MKMRMKTALLAPVVLGSAIVAGSAEAAPIVDFATSSFTNGSTGSFTIADVVVEAFQYNGTSWVQSRLWKRNETGDHGFGVCNTAETCLNTGGGDINELDNSGLKELIRLTLPAGKQWTSFWLSSLDSGGTGSSEEARVWADFDSTLDAPGAAGQNLLYDLAYPAFGATAVEGFKAVSPTFALAPYLLFEHKAVAGDDNNDYLVWGVDIADRSITAVPEPASLGLLGLGLAALAGRLRRRR